MTDLSGFLIVSNSHFPPQHFLHKDSHPLPLNSYRKRHRGLRKFSVQAGKPPNAHSRDLRIGGVKDIIAIASGKGDVGKSTTAAVLLASKCRLKVGLLDADVYGPSIPIMMKLEGKPQVTAEKKMIPIENYGVRCMSIGSLVEEGAALVWRAPMVIKLLNK